jgi:hypothetical protein
MFKTIPLFKWIKAITIVLLGSLIYAVYFTELGKPETFESDQQISMYHLTAAPTLFVQWYIVPTVELDWAMASQNLLKFSILVHDLETTIDPADWICNPHITMDPPVPRRFRGYEMGVVYGESGEFIRAIYEYEIDASDRKSLAIDLDITIGPCADYLNFSESNVTAEVIPELVGNYHLSFQVPVKNDLPSLSSTPAGMSMETWRDIPIFPGGIESNDNLADLPVYHYIIEETGIDIVLGFYEDQMLAAGWESLGMGNIKTGDIEESYALWFAKEKVMATVNIFEKNNMTHVDIRLE